jgi:hypothetical protein
MTTSCGDSCADPTKYYVGDIGTEIIVDTCSDISTATLVSLKVKKPDDTEVEWVGAIYDTTKIRYIVLAGDFDQSGKYRVQSYVEMPGWEGRGDTTYFKVSADFG